MRHQKSEVGASTQESIENIVNLFIYGMYKFKSIEVQT